MRVANLFVFIVLGLFVQAGFSQEKSPVITKGSNVELEFTLTLADGSLVQSNVDQAPLAYVQGAGQLLPALETALDGHAANDEVTVQLSADEGYGPIRNELYRDVPIDQIPEDARTVGTMLSADGVDGPIRVHEVREDVVILDLNHPLAGEALNFDIRVISVQAGPADAG